MKINIVFSELESLIPYLVRWNRELESLQSDMQINISTVCESDRVDSAL